MRAALAEGQADVAHAAVDNSVAMVELTGADVAIVMGGEGSLNELFVQPDIHSAAELRGKTLIVDAVNTAYALQMKKILLLNGLQAGRDYEMKPYGATPQRLVAMREHKEFAGSMLGPPASIVAKRSEEHTSELQSRLHLVCRLLLEKKKKEAAVAVLRSLARLTSPGIAGIVDLSPLVARLEGAAHGFGVPGCALLAALRPAGLGGE